MEVDEIELQRQVSKFQRVSSNGSTTTTDNSSNPVRIASNGDGGSGGSDVVRVCGWPSSRIVRVSRASGGKDRHSKVLTSKGLRDRRVRLSVNTAIQFYDLQDRLGYDQPSKAVEWLLKAAASSIDELPSLDPPFLGQISDDKKKTVNVTHQTSISESKSKSKSKSPACSSTSETSKGSGLSLSRSENRNKARERAREMASHKKELDDSARVTVLNQVNCFQETSSFTDLLTGRSPMDYFFNRPNQPAQLIGIPQFHNPNPNPNQHQQHHQFSFMQDSFVPAGTTTGGGGETYNLNFGMTSPSPAATAAGGGGVIPGGYSRGTLQSNLQQSLLPHQHHLHPDGSTSANLPFFIVPNAGVDHYSAAVGPGGYHLGYGGDAGGRRSDNHKEKSKN